MIVNMEKIRAISFDLGNTLIEYGPKQIALQYEALVCALTRMFGSCDLERLETVRRRQILAPYRNDYRENNMQNICGELIQGIYDVEPEKSQVDTIVRIRYESFVESAQLAGDVLPLLKKLGERYRLGLLSNYPCSRSIRDSLKKIGLSKIFHAEIISGDVGYAKPHPRPFEVLLSDLGVSPGECVHVGDNWLADIQGAKRTGMGAILITQYIPYEKFEPNEGDIPPDARIERLYQLEQLLLLA